MNLEHVLQLLTAAEFDTLLEEAFEQGPDDLGGFKVENIRTAANRTTVSVLYDTGDRAEIEVSGSKEHV